MALADNVRPTVEDVAILERSRTGGTTALGSAEGTEGTFTDNTHPTATEVEQYIDMAMDLLVPQIGPDVLPTHWPLIRRAVALEAAILIEGSVFREQVDEGAVALWTSLLTRIMSSALTLTNAVVTEDGGTPSTPPARNGYYVATVKTVSSTAPPIPLPDPWLA